MGTPVLGTVYLIHFDSPLHHAKHYLGWTKNLDARLEEHRKGNGSKLLAALRRAGISWRLVRTWDNVDRHFERKLKKRKKATQFCSACSGEAALGCACS